MTLRNDEDFNIFAEMEKYGHEQLIFNYDKATGLKLIIGIHDTSLGPAVGGCRMWPYETEQQAIIDVLRLSRGMTYKCAASKVMRGGGKAVILGDPQDEKSDELFQALGSFVETLHGRFMTGTDVGTTGMDFVSSAKQTKYVNGLPEEYGGSGNSGIITAFGLFQALKATAVEAYGNLELNNLTVSVQGLGKVGQVLIQYLLDAGAQVIATDLFEERINLVKKMHSQVTFVQPDEIYGVECHIFSPNALGGILNDKTIPQLKCRAICGAANNQLSEARHGDQLHQMGILYAPDYVVNAGGLIGVVDEFHGFNKERAFQNATLISTTLYEIFAMARERDLPTYQVADLISEETIKKILGIKAKSMGYGG